MSDAVYCGSCGEATEYLVDSGFCQECFDKSITEDEE